MVIWFITLFISGAYSVVLTPEIIAAINPVYALNFFLLNGVHGFFALSMIVLCATGAEALFADMGHLGREPIQYAWGFVFIAVFFSYLGQAAFLLRNVGIINPLFEMIFWESHILYIPFLLLTIIATVIASQAVISGIFSIIYQAITTHLLPMLPIDYTSDELRTQIYINSVNWFLCIAVIIVLLIFQYSEKLANAYGLAVTGTMSITGIFMISIFFFKRRFLLMSYCSSCNNFGYYLLHVNTFKSGTWWVSVLNYCIHSIYGYFDLHIRTESIIPGHEADGK